MTTGRKIELSDSDSEVVILLNRAITRHGSLHAVSALIGCRYSNLWSIYREQRGIPLRVILKLCALLKMSDHDTIRSLERIEPQDKKD